MKLFRLSGTGKISEAITALRKAGWCAVAYLLIRWHYVLHHHYVVKMQRGPDEWVIFDVRNFDRARQLKAFYERLGYRVTG